MNLHRLFLRALPFLFVSLVCLTGAAIAEPPEVSDADAHRYVGKEVVVCGRVASTAYLESVRGSPTFLNLGAAYPNHTFTVVIWADARSRFTDPPETFFDEAEICVTGRVETYKGKPQIVVRDPAKIRVTEARLVPDRYRDEERVVLKAILTALGYPSDSGSGEWDQEARGALAAFQSDEGIVQEGDRSAPTLRRLAEKVDTLTDAEKTDILRLFLLNMAQREEP